jgi:hypothetical protein
MAVYFVMVDVDFIVLIRCRTKKEPSGIIEQLTKTEGAERSSTFYVLDRLKENYNESVLIDDVAGAEAVRSSKKEEKKITSLCLPLISLAPDFTFSLY